MRLMLRSEVRTDVGSRRNNEDCLFASPRLAAVADGVGGAAAGEVASRVIINALIHLDKCRLQGSLDDALADAVAWGNDTVGFVAECRPETAGMSTTLTAVAVGDDDTYALVNIGDSRTYLFRDGVLTRLTRDDSLVQQLIERGHVTEAQARRHPRRSLVLEALDGRPRNAVEVTIVPAQTGDRLLLCSDGLSDVVDDDALAVALDGAAARPCAQSLVDLALAEGGRDNVSVVVVDVVSTSDASAAWD